MNILCDETAPLPAPASTIARMSPFCFLCGTFHSLKLSSLHVYFICIDSLHQQNVFPVTTEPLYHCLE